MSKTLHTFSILAIHEHIFYSKNIILHPLADVTDAMSAKRLTTCEVKVMCPRYCLRHDLGLFISIQG